MKADLREPSRVCVKAEPFSALTVGLEIDRIAAGCARERPCARGAPHFFPGRRHVSDEHSIIEELSKRKVRRRFVDQLITSQMRSLE